MSDDGLLPAPLHEELCASVPTLFWGALSRLTHQNSLSATQDTIDAIYSSLHVALVNEMRLRNSRFSPQARLPNEIWCTIWNNLSFLDLVAVSHVCSRWRAVSRGCLSLWASPILYTAQSAHHDGWGCGTCSYENGDPGYCDDNPYPANSSNTPFVDDIFALSGDLLLDIRVDVVAHCAYREFFVWADSALASHAHRISGLTLWSWDPDTPGNILANLDALPVLRSFSVRTYYPSAHPNPMVAFFPRTLQLPQLESITLDENYEFPPLMSLQLHSVRTLRFTPRDWESLLGVLDACTSLERLSLCLFHLLSHDLSSQLGARVRNLIAMVRNIEIGFVTPCSDEWVVATFYRADMRNFSLGYFLSLGDELPHGHTIFKDLQGAVRLTIATKPDWLFRSLVIMDSQGRTRTLIPYSDHLTNVLSRVLDPSCLRPDTLRHITVALTCWDDFASACLFFPSVASLAITIQEKPDPHALFESAVESPHASPVPELKDLQIIYTGRRNTLVVSPDDLARLVRKVAPRLPLQTLVLRGRIQVDEGALPDGLSVDFHILHTVEYEQQ